MMAISYMSLTNEHVFENACIAINEIYLFSCCTEGQLTEGQLAEA